MRQDWRELFGLFFLSDSWRMGELRIALPRTEMNVWGSKAFESDISLSLLDESIELLIQHVDASLDNEVVWIDNLYFTASVMALLSHIVSKFGPRNLTTAVIQRWEEKVAASFAIAAAKKQIGPMEDELRQELDKLLERLRYSCNAAKVT